MNAPATVTLDELRNLPAVALAVTLECAGNGRTGFQPLPEGDPWSGQAVGTVRWAGMRLAGVLSLACPHVDAAEVTFTGCDGGEYKGHHGIEFTRSLPLDYALRPEHDVLLAFAMNDEPLTPAHGAPLRLIVPG